jgi:dUTP pyrophosphatase
MSDIPMIQIKKLHEDAQLPEMASKDAGGMDLRTIESANIPAGRQALLKTGLAIAIPEGMVGLIWPRSKLAVKFGLTVMGGVIDADYRGEIMISLLNTGDDTVEIKKGDRCAQLIVQPVYTWLPVSVVNSLDETERGSKGILSSEIRLQ